MTAPKIYDVLVAIDVPHYGTAIVEAESPEMALDAARKLDPAEICDDAGWDVAFCPRIVHMYDPDGAVVAEDMDLDEDNAFVLVGQRDKIRAARASAEMLAALELALPAIEATEASLGHGRSVVGDAVRAAIAAARGRA